MITRIRGGIIYVVWKQTIGNGWQSPSRQAIGPESDLFSFRTGTSCYLLTPKVLGCFEAFVFRWGRGDAAVVLPGFAISWKQNQVTVQPYLQDPRLYFTSGLHGPVSISVKTSYRKISWSLEAARLAVQIIASLWNMTGTPTAVLPRCLSNFRAII